MGEYNHREREREREREIESYWWGIFLELPAWAMEFKPGQHSSWATDGNKRWLCNLPLKTGERR